ncbi:hypothetical protein TGAM01_v206710 [Trichoderma gamsii]|uniref:Uncharacterized protein n=1 Tax=Trichoderma gamsii TaxID=398673 RepID=A0A2P4ZJB8_9HYPO|nr:hypothetical protein TGAM01_v206710 [Trichoderma gamsii]PON24378.1 hypothetical protein TGAM01_v206710 [Trichoderma gamsii]
MQIRSACFERALHKTPTPFLSPDGSQLCRMEPVFLSVFFTIQLLPDTTAIYVLCRYTISISNTNVICSHR